jgi:hypothetical protein
MENESKMSLPCMRDKCIGKACGNFGERGCKGGKYPPWNWAKWYNEQDFTKKEINNNEDNSMDKT